MTVGISNISFFGPDGSTHNYVDDSGTFRYERDRSGAEFLFNIGLARDRSVSIRVAVFEHERTLNELEEDAWKQLKRILVKLGKIGEEMKDSKDSGATKEDGAKAA